MIRNKSGVWGEIFAARYLRDNGCRILTSNYVCRFGELDIVASKGGKLLFVEVKTRNVSAEIRPMEAVDAGKQARLEAAAKSYMKALNIDAAARFDVCEVYLEDDMTLSRINYIKNAFQEAI